MTAASKADQKGQDMDKRKSNLQTVVGYRCPHCGHGVLSPIGVFSLSGDMLKLKCTCGESELILQKTSDGRVHLAVPCMVCPRPHHYTLSEGLFFREDLFTLSCEMTGLDLCFIGQEQEVSDALDEAGDALMSMLRETGYEPGEDEEEGETDRDVNFTDNHIYDMVLFVVRDLQEEGKIRCRCTDEGESGVYDVVYDKDRLFVICEICGAKREICCNGSLSTQAFLDSDSLTLEGTFEKEPESGISPDSRTPKP
ncbi:MAG: hypothetical protein J5494_05025 [Candidatus Methanomethylophilaceae archaeon]|nr:hypothetical protein [Candidatus Methanomethylophilaceae archaeon]